MWDANTATVNIWILIVGYYVFANVGDCVDVDI